MSTRAPAELCLQITATIGDTPPAGNATPATTGRAAAEKALKDAEDAQKNARSNLASKKKRFEGMEGGQRYSPEILDDYHKKITDNFTAKKKFEEATKHLAAQPSPENLHHSARPRQQRPRPGDRGSGI